MPEEQPTSQQTGAQPSFFAYHSSEAISAFAKKRIAAVGESFKYFNIGGLLKSLFMPYRRMTVGKKNAAGYLVGGLIDRISFNLVSIFMGFSVRLILIIAGLIIASFLAIFSLVSIPVFAIFPFFALPGYLKLVNNTFYEPDLADSQKFLKKLYASNLFSYLTIFFEDGFVKSFETLPAPISLGITFGQVTKDILASIIKNHKPIAKYLEEKNIKEKHLEILINHLDNVLNKPKKAPVTPIGQMLSFGYTATLDKFCTELTEQYLSAPSNFEVLTQIEKVLTRPSGNNVLLVGEPGVGRHTVLLNLASAIQRLQLPGLEGHRVMLLDTIALAGTGQNLIEVRSNFEATLEEAKRAGNIILAIDQIDRIATAQDNRTDLSEVVTTALTDNSLPLIGITTPDDFNRYIRPSGNFMKLFEKMDIGEPTQDETIGILIGKSLSIYSQEFVGAYLDAIAEIATKSNRLVLDRRQPEKSIVLLQDTVAEAKSRHLKRVDVPLVDEILSQKTKTPIGKITQKEGEKLKDLEAILHKRVIGQNEAIVQIAKAMRRARAEIETGSRPIGSFLFLGPTGVGKTETAKALAEAYFGAEDRMVRFDMTEFQGAEAMQRLIGDPNTQSPGQLPTRIRENPYCLLLVDEFEKASKDVHNLFLQILDEGFLTDAFGKKVSFDNVIVIATSNAGAEFIREQLDTKIGLNSATSNNGQGSTLSEKLVDYVLKKGLFNPELINRFDGVIVYHPLTPAQVVEVATLMLNNLAKSLKTSKNITVEISPQVAQIIAQKGFDPTFGARPLRRLIADKIEDGIAKMIIDGSAKSGSKVDAGTLLKFVS